MKKKVAFFSLLLAFVSCGGDNSSKNNSILADNIILDAFNGIQVDSLKGEFIDVEMIAPNQCIFCGNYFIVSHSFGRVKKNISIYKKDNFELVGHYIDTGKAVNEISLMSMILNAEEKENVIELILNDIGTGVIKKFAIPKNPSDSSFVSAVPLLNSKDTIWKNSANYFDFNNNEANCIHVDRTNFSSIKYKKLNFVGNLLFEKELINPEINHRDDLSRKTMIASLCPSTKPDNSKFVFHSTTVNQLNIYDCGTNKITTTTILSEIPNYAFTIENGKTKDAPFYYFGGLCQNDDRIIVAYLNASLLEILENLTPLHEKTTLHIYDWDGKGRGILVIDEGVFTIDFETGYLYSLNTKTEKLYRYDIKKYIL